ncbi:MAG: hydroxymethylglutaryl-CoA synthase family protein, partial [Acidimicrobiales bacterium]|nr:hydroxymethylglutaryl-CoA synthase family protein [Acidimicrobiales bacterium]
MTSPVRILAVGVAAPSLRLQAADVGAAWGSSGRGQVATCGPDEDTLTLAWTAATRALAAGGIAADEVGAVYWGTSRPPFAEGPSLAFLTGSLSLSPTVGGALVSGSAHAGIDALLAGWDAVAAGSADVVLVIASDAVVPGLGTTLEGRTGAGAVALVLAGAGGSAALTQRSTRTRPVLDRYRGDAERGLRDVYDGRLFREEVYLPEVTGAAAALGADAARWSLPDPDGRLAATAA